ncbi:MAG: ComEC/Rec2 family competence protein [Pseudomonadota bacterium]
MMETSVPQHHDPPRQATLRGHDRGLAFEALAQGWFFIWMPVCLGAGIGAYFWLRFEPAYAVYPALAALAVSLPWLARYSLLFLPAAWATCFLCLGFSVAGFHAHHSAAPVLGFRYYGPIEGRIVGIDRSGSGKVRLTLDQVRLDRMAPDRRPVRVRVSLHGDQPYLDPQPGQMVMMTGHLSPPSGPVEPHGFDFQRHTWFQQLGAVGYTRTPALLQRPGEAGNLQMRIFRLRMSLSQAIKDRLPEREGAFATAILTGDRSSIDQDALDALRASNLAHLLAISGLHMGLLTGVVFTLIRSGLALSPSAAMRSNPKKIAAIAAFCVGVFYLALSGANVATQRAFVMVGVMLIAICLDRRALTLRAVAVAALIVLAINPESLTGPGFQMSFAATTALVAVFAEIRERQLLLGWPNWARNLASLVISSGVAGLATAPIAAVHFNQMAQWGLIANLLSVPMMGIVVMPGAVLAALLAPIGLEQIGLELMRLGVAWILLVAETVASWDSSLRLIRSPEPIVLPIIGIAGAMLCLLQGRARLSGLPVLGLALGLWAISDRPAVLIADTGGLIGVMTPEGRALNKARGDGFAARVWGENDALRIPQDRAAELASFSRKNARFELGGKVVHFVADKDLEEQDVAKLCATTALLIVPLYKETPACAAITAQDLRQSGSIAINADEDGLVITTSRKVRGERLWVPN